MSKNAPISDEMWERLARVPAVRAKVAEAIAADREKARLARDQMPIPVIVQKLRSMKEGHATVGDNVKECGPAWFFHRNKIEQYQFEAAMLLRKDWEAAQVGHPGAVDLLRPTGGMWRDLSVAQLNAIERLTDALAAVTMVSGAIAVNWCCEGWTIGQIERALGWSQERGYGLTRMKEALDEFAHHYRLT